MTPSLWRLMWNHILRRATQSLLFVIGVMIGVAMMVSIDIANNSARKGFELSTEAIVGKATHDIIGGPTGLDEQFYTHIRTAIGWQKAAPVVSDYVVAEQLNEPAVRVFGIDPFAEGPFRSYVTASGQIIAGDGENAELQAVGRFLFEPNTVLMGEQFATNNNIRPGDSLELQYGGEIRTVTVVGLLRSTDKFSDQALANMLITDISTAQELFNKQGVLTNINLIIDDTPAGQRALEQIEAALPTGATLNTAAARSNAVSQMTKAFELNLTAMSLLALVVGMFLVYNTVTFSVVQRRPVLGILRSLGVTRRQVFILIWGEAAILSAVGAILGLGLGIILGRFTVAAVTQTVNDAYFTVTVQQTGISTFILLKGFSVGVGAALFAALLPAYEATNTPPTSVTRRSVLEQRMLRLVPWISLLGILSACIGGVMLTIEQSLIANLFGVFAIVVGLAFLTVLATIILTRAINPVTSQIGGVVGRMAPRNILRNLSRTSIAITALMMAVSVIVGVTTMVGSFRISVRQWLEDTLRADIFISQPNNSGSLAGIPVSRDVIGEIEAVDGVARVSYVRTVYVQAPDDPRPVLLNAIMDDISEGRRNIIQGMDLSQDEIVHRLVQGDGLLMTEVFANSRNIEWRDGLTYTLLTEEGPYAFPVLGIYQDFSSPQGTVVIGLDTYQRLWHDDQISNLAAYVEPNADISTVVTNIKAAVAERRLVVQSNRELRESALVVFDRTFAITSALNLLATLVAFVGILSALMSLQIERKREIGIMRSNGLTRWQLLRLTLWETGIMGFIAGVVAMPVGLVLAVVLIYIINLRSFGWSLALNLQWEFFGQAFAVSLIAALLAGIYPAWRVGHIQPVEAIRSE